MSIGEPHWHRPIHNVISSSEMHVHHLHGLVLSSAVALELLKEVLHLVGDEVLKLLSKLLDLGLELLGASGELAADALDLLLNILHRGQGDVNDLGGKLVATVGDDLAVVGLATTVPGKELHNLLARRISIDSG